ncbi:MAG: hypothetical protein WC565_06895 [Parcubacteria group bacterium]
MTTIILTLASIGAVALLLVGLASLWVGGGVDAHLEMSEHEKRCKR